MSFYPLSLDDSAGCKCEAEHSDTLRQPASRLSKDVQRGIDA